jgi:large subunit ribosomal protein L32
VFKIRINGHFFAANGDFTRRKWIQSAILPGHSGLGTGRRAWVFVGFSYGLLEILIMLPVKKTSKSRTRTRRSHHRLRAVNYSICKKCESPKLPHAACDNCGYLNPKITLKLAKKEETS